MADGDRIIIGQANTASNPGNETTLSRNAGTARTVFVARNLNVGDGIHGEASGSSTGVQGTSASGTGVMGNSPSGVGVEGFNISGGVGMRGNSLSGVGVEGVSSSAQGVQGHSVSGFGVGGSSTIGFGVWGSSGGDFGTGVRGTNSSAQGAGVDGTSLGGFGTGVRGIGGGIGVAGSSPSGSGTGVEGTSPSGVGVSGSSSTSIGVQGHSDFDIGVSGSSIGIGVRGTTTSGVGVSGSSSTTGVAVEGFGINMGVWGDAGASGVGVGGTSNGSIGVSGFSLGGIDVSGIGVNGTGSGIGVFGHSPEPGGDAGNFLGHVQVNGSVDVTGNKNFKIDHPLDPENRYLSHTCVESSEMKNVYDGVARLDKGGAAWVELPEWFEALNGDLRYQLTAVGGAAPNLHVAEELSENRFKIAGGEEGMKVCWQLTGSRKDRWATANPFEVEQEKSEQERGRYLDPSLYEAPEARRVMIGPIAETLRAVSTSPSGKEAVEALRRRMEEEQRPPQPSGIDFARLQEERLRQMMRQQPPHPVLRDFHRRRHR